MQEKTFDYKGSKIFYKVKGSGKLLILIHGFGEDSNIWNNIFLKFSESMKVVAPDIPGSGRSEILKKSNYQSSISIDNYALTINEIIDRELNSNYNKDNLPEKVSIIGHSMGGYIALSYANLYPEKVEKIGLFHSTVFADDELKIAVRKKAIEFIQKNGAYNFLKISIPDLFSPMSKLKFQDSIQEILVQAKNFTEQALIQYYEAMITRKDHTNLLIRLKVPFLFIIGEDDKAVPLNISLQQCHIADISQILILQDVAHMGMIEASDKCYYAIKSFLTDL